MHTVKLDSLDLNDGSDYEVQGRPIFQQAKLRTDIQPYLSEHGGEVVNGTDYYDVVTHTIPIQVKGTSIDDLHTNIRTLQQKVLKRNVVLEFKWDGATNTNYADVLYSECDDPYSQNEWDFYERDLKALVNVYLTCKPFWRGAKVTNTLQSLTVTPAKLMVSSSASVEDLSSLITYVGGGWGISYNVLYSGGSHKYAYSAITQYAEFTFVGTSIIYIATKKSTYGIAKVYIDNVAITDGDTALTGDVGGNKSGVDLYSAGSLYQQSVYTKSDLSLGQHSIKIYVSMEKNVASSGYNVILDRLDYSSAIAGNVTTPAIIEFQGTATGAFGTNLYVGARGDAQIVESNFNPIKDFTGSTGSGMYGGQFLRRTILNGWVSFTGASTGASATANIKAISMADANVGWIVGDGGLIAKTTNGWTTSTIQTSNTSQGLNKVKVIDTNIVYTVGDHGVIRKTTNGGTSWVTKASTLTTRDLWGLTFASTNVGWISKASLGSEYMIYKTTNGGNTWVEQGNVFSLAGLSDMHAVNSNVVFQVRSDQPGLYKTTDGGTTWTILGATGLVSGKLAIYMPTASIGWAVGAVGSLQRTTNGGTNWTTQVSGTTSYLLDITASSTRIAWAVGNAGTILKTTNSGATWVKQTSNVASNIKSIHHIDSSQVHAAGDGYSVLKTTNGGTAWNRMGISAWALSSPVDYKGRYKVFARARTNSTKAASAQLRVGSGWAGGSVVYNSAVNLSSTKTTMQWANLGTVSVPATNLSSGVSATPIIVVEGKNGSTKSTSFDMDVAALLPVDGESSYISGEASITDYITADYSNEAVNRGRTNVNYVGDPGIQLRPGNNNNIVCLETKTYSTGSQGINPVNVSVSYYPRYLSPVR